MIVYLTAHYKKLPETIQFFSRLSALSYADAHHHVFPKVRITLKECDK